MASFTERNVRIDNIKLKEVVRKKPNHIWKIADTIFEGDVRGSISDVNRAARIIQVRKRTNLSEAVFWGISFNITTTLTF